MTEVAGGELCVPQGTNNEVGAAGRSSKNNKTQQRFYSAIFTECSMEIIYSFR